MKERPILLNGDMVRAVLNGSKTQTRRIMKVQPSADFSPMNMELETDFTARWYMPGVVDKDGYLQPAKKQVFGVASEDEGYTSPFGAVGDRLWVREAWARYNIDQDSHDIAYRATIPDDWPKEGRWRPSIHMPRWASRITLEITGVRVERLQDISAKDVTAEGIKTLGESMWGSQWWDDAPQAALNDAQLQFSIIWSKIYGEQSWQANPWVWVIEFKRVEGE